MAQQQSGKPWSGANPIPNIQRFVHELDKDKKARDAHIDAQGGAGDGVVAHHNEPPKGATNKKTVTDPTTGKQVQIEDVGRDFMKAVKDPQVGICLVRILHSLTALALRPECQPGQRHRLLSNPILTRFPAN